MGADFLGAFVPMETSRDSAKNKLREYPEKYVLDTLSDYFAQEFYDEDGKTEYEQALEYVDAQIDIVYDLYQHESREVTVFKYRDVDILVTGGMSWGDDPTDAFQSMGVVQSLELTMATPVLQIDGGGKR